MRIICMFALCLVVLSNCAAPINRAVPVETLKAPLPQDKSLIVFGFSAAGAEGERTVSLQFDQFSLERNQITGNCQTFNRLEVEVPSDGRRRYFAFNAPPGHYIVSPYNIVTDDETTLVAFDVPAGSVSYLGDFYKQQIKEGYEGTVISRREDMEKAADFARSIGSRSLPVRAPMQALTHRGGVFICYP